MNKKLIETDNLILKRPDIEVQGQNSLTILIKYTDETCKIADIVYFLNSDTPQILTYKTNLQDCITSWELYQEFIKLVDEAYFILQSK